MFYSVMQAESLCEDDPSLIFSLIQESDKEVIEKVISKPNFDFNIENQDGNNVIMYLLKYKHYDFVLKYIDKVDLNHQNKDGDTLAHLLVELNYVNVKEIMEYVFVNPHFILNLKNKKGETILDKSIHNHSLYTSMKILENRRFNSIDVYSFKNLYETYIKNNYYGPYSKESNLEIILENLETKRLLPRMRRLISLIENNLDKIKRDFYESKTENLDHIIKIAIHDTLG